MNCCNKWTKIINSFLKEEWKCETFDSMAGIFNKATQTKKIEGRKWSSRWKEISKKKRLQGCWLWKKKMGKSDSFNIILYIKATILLPFETKMSSKVVDLHISNCVGTISFIFQVCWPWKVSSLPSTHLNNPHPPTPSTSCCNLMLNSTTDFSQYIHEPKYVKT